MRRAIASLLLALLSFPLLAALLFADSVSELPACCRRDGKHHCAMLEMAGGQDDASGPGLKAMQPKCPLYPKAAPVQATSKITLPGGQFRIGAPAAMPSAIGRPAANPPLAVPQGSVRKRGPPACSNLHS